MAASSGVAAPSSPPLVIVKQPDQRRFGLQYNASEKISDIKSAIQRVKGFMSENQLLLLGDETLLDGRMLGDYDIHPGTELDLFICKDQGDTDAVMVAPSPPLGECIPAFFNSDGWENNVNVEQLVAPVVCEIVHLMTSTGRSIILHVEADDTIGHVKARIQRQENILHPEQRLIFKGEQLEDMRRLSEYNVDQTTTMLIHLDLKGHHRREVEMRHAASGETFMTLWVDLGRNDNIRKLKEKIEAQDGIEASRLTLAYEECGSLFPMKAQTLYKGDRTICFVD
jgi:hypothetical protein